MRAEEQLNTPEAIKGRGLTTTSSTLRLLSVLVAEYALYGNSTDIVPKPLTNAIKNGYGSTYSRTVSVHELQRCSDGHVGSSTAHVWPGRVPNLHSVSETTPFCRNCTTRRVVRQT